MSAPSFHALYAQERRATPYTHPKWAYNDKIAARTLAALCDVPVTDLIAGPIELDAIEPPDRPVVIKPQHGCGGRGVLPLEPRARGYRDILRGRTLTWAQVFNEAHAAIGTSGLPATHPDKPRGPWIVEALIPGPKPAMLPYDWQFYMIGGNVQLIRQSRGQAAQFVKWYAPDWSELGAIHTSPAKWKHDATMPGPNSSRGLLDAARRIAKDFPSHFVRVDLYEHDDRVLFGEVTPHPSGGKMRFEGEWDARLGAAWIKATS